TGNDDSAGRQPRNSCCFISFFHPPQRSQDKERKGVIFSEISEESGKRSIGQEPKMCMDRSPVPAKKIWLAIASRLGLRPTAGLRNLRKEVRTCEYRDVHIMWE
uniref:Uncharacterized protein n=1 Tax=Aegilops tauschii subsp. strangulata TaxID=200361 RepID=A0A453LW22_AEGTS